MLADMIHRMCLWERRRKIVPVEAERRKRLPSKKAADAMLSSSIDKLQATIESATREIRR